MCQDKENGRIKELLDLIQVCQEFNLHPYFVQLLVLQKFKILIDPFQANSLHNSPALAPLALEQKSNVLHVNSPDVNSEVHQGYQVQLYETKTKCPRGQC